jgi:hypothetical protein
MIVKHGSALSALCSLRLLGSERIITLYIMACTMLQKSALLGTALPAVRPTSARPQAMVRFYGSGGGRGASTLHAVCDINMLLARACAAGWCRVECRIKKVISQAVMVAYLKSLVAVLLAACREDTCGKQRVVRPRQGQVAG